MDEYTESEYFPNEGIQADAEYLPTADELPAQDYLDDLTYLTTGEVDPLEVDLPDNYVEKPENFVERKAGVASDIMEVAQGAASGEIDVIAHSLERFSQNQFERFLDARIVAPLLLFWAYRGKMSSVERLVMAGIGVGYFVGKGRKFAEDKKIAQSELFQNTKDQVYNVFDQMIGS